MDLSSRSWLFQADSRFLVRQQEALVCVFSSGKGSRAALKEPPLLSFLLICLRWPRAVQSLLTKGLLVTRTLAKGHFYPAGGRQHLSEKRFGHKESKF